MGDDYLDLANDAYLSLAKAQRDELDEKITGLYSELHWLKAQRDKLDAQIAGGEIYPLPKPRYRTAKQATIALCPRCHGEIQ